MTVFDVGEPTAEEKIERVRRALRREVLEQCAKECDAQAEAIQEDLERDDRPIEPTQDFARNGQRAAYCEMALHFREQKDRIVEPPPPRRSAVSYVEREDGRILCVWNKRYGGWSMPGGMVEDGETIEQAQARELREETSLETVEARYEYRGPCVGDGAVAERVEADHRATIVNVFRVIATGCARETEPGCPVTWLTREEFLRWSPFSRIYQRVFEVVVSIPLRQAKTPNGAGPKIVGRDGGLTWLTDSNAEVERLSGALRRVRSRVVDLRDEYMAGVRDGSRPGDGPIGALHLAIAALNEEMPYSEMMRSNAENSERRGKRWRTTPFVPFVGAAAEEKDDLHAALRKITQARRPPGSHVDELSAADCLIHGWPTPGLPKRIVDAVARGFENEMKVCSGCIDRIKQEADRERSCDVP